NIWPLYHNLTLLPWWEEHTRLSINNSRLNIRQRQTNTTIPTFVSQRIRMRNWCRFTQAITLHQSTVCYLTKIRLHLRRKRGCATYAQFYRLQWFRVYTSFTQYSNIHGGYTRKERWPISSNSF